MKISATNRPSINVVIKAKLLNLLLRQISRFFYEKISENPGHLSKISGENSEKNPSTN